MGRQSQFWSGSGLDVISFCVNVTYRRAVMRCMERTDTRWAVSAAVLAHTLGGFTEQAYALSDLLDKRRSLLQQWADFLAGDRVAG